MTETEPVRPERFPLQAPDHCELLPYKKNILFQSAVPQKQTILSKNDHFPGLTLNEKVYSLEDAMFITWPNYESDIYGADDSVPKHPCTELATWIDKQHQRWFAQDNITHAVYPYPNKENIRGIDPLATNQKYAAVAQITDTEGELMLFRFSTLEWRPTEFIFEAITGACFEDCGDRLFVSTTEGVMCINVAHKPKKVWYKKKLFKTDLGTVMKTTEDHVLVFDRANSLIHVLNIDTGHEDQVIPAVGFSMTAWHRWICVGSARGKVSFYHKDDTTVKKDVKVVDSDLKVVDEEIPKPSYKYEREREYMKKYVSITKTEIDIPPDPILTLSMVATKLFMSAPTAVIMEDNTPGHSRLMALNNMGAVLSNFIVGDMSILLFGNSRVVIGKFGDATNIYQYEDKQYPPCKTTGRQFVCGTLSRIHALMMNGDMVVFHPT